MALGMDARNASVNARTALVNGGKLQLRSGSTTRGEIALEATAFGTAASGEATANGFPKTVTLSAGGDLDNYRMLDSSDNVEWDGTIANTADPDDPYRLVLTQVNVASGSDVRVNSVTHGQPE